MQTHNPPLYHALQEISTGGGAEFRATTHERLIAETAPRAEEWRAIGLFGPAFAVPDDADPQVRLLGLTGCNPYSG